MIGQDTVSGHGIFGLADRIQLVSHASKLARWGPYPSGMELREERPGGREFVRDIHLRAFGDHGLVVADLVDTLRDTITPVDGLSLVAEQDGRIAGHAMFTRSLFDAVGAEKLVQVMRPGGIR